MDLPSKRQTSSSKAHEINSHGGFSLLSQKLPKDAAVNAGGCAPKRLCAVLGHTA